MSYWLQDENGNIVHKRSLPVSTIEIGNNQIGEIHVDLNRLSTPAKYILCVKIEDTDFMNDWDVWVYPASINEKVPPNILITDNLDDSTLEFLDQGGTVLVALKPQSIITPVEIGFSSIFWNTAWTRNQAPHTLGILCNPKHPAFREFTTDYHSDWQWWELTNAMTAAAMVLDKFPAELVPIVQPIDTWFENRRLGLLFEARIGKGKALVCSMDITSGLEERFVARQIRYSLLRYMVSDAFQPQIEVKPELIQSMIHKKISLDMAELKELELRFVSVNSETTENPGVHAVDGLENTFWHTQWKPTPARLPHFLIVELIEELPVKAMKFTPRQDIGQGRIGLYEIYVSHDGENWGEPVYINKMGNTSETISCAFDPPLQGKYIKLLTRSEANGNDFSALAEWQIYTDKVN